MKPLAIDLFCGLGGWSDGLIGAGWDCVGFDLEQHDYGEGAYPGQLVIQDVLALRGRQFRDASLIVASPPCQAYSYMAMPWTRAKDKARDIREDKTGEKFRALNRLFETCFRLQREASEAAGRHIPMVVENVRGAQPWVGRARWNFGSYYLWGDVPALMPPIHRRTDFRKSPGENVNRASYTSDHSWKGGLPNGNRSSDQQVTDDGHKLPGFRFDGSGRSFQSEAVAEHLKNGTGGSWFGVNPNGTPGALNNARDGRKGVGSGPEWFDANLCKLPSASPRRKAASARIAKIPFTLAEWIGRTYLPLKS